MKLDPLAAPVDDGHCIGCGKRSSIGLKMRFEASVDGSVESTVTVPERFQGWRGVVHGGVVALLLDEAMAYASAAHGYLGVTADLKLRFRGAAPIGAPLVVRSRVLWKRRNVLGLSATVASADGTVFASGEGSFVTRGKLPPGQKLGELDVGA